MCEKSHPISLRRIISMCALALFFAHMGQSNPMINDGQKSPLVAENDRSEKSKDIPTEQELKASLPTTDYLVKAKLEALRSKLSIQDKALAEAEFKRLEEENKTKSIFDNNANLQLSIINTAKALDYRLERTEIYIDGKLLARGGKRNRGLPRRSEIFFGPIKPGCHEILVKMKYVRLKNDIISQFKVNRVEQVTRGLTFIAKDGYQIEIEIEGREVPNTFVNLYRGPGIVFNKLVKRNFLPGKPLLPLESIFQQGRLVVDYITEEASRYKLIEKSLSIDGLPVLVKAKHDASKNGSMVFDAPLLEGRHTLSTTLLFGEQKWVGGGPIYNFRMKFDRDFYVIRGQTTIINLTGMPKDGFGTELNTRYARAVSKILAADEEGFFPENTCKEVNAKQDAVTAQALPAKESVKEPIKSLQPTQENLPKKEAASSEKSDLPENAPQPKSAVGE